MCLDASRGGIRIYQHLTYVTANAIPGAASTIYLDVAVTLLLLAQRWSELISIDETKRKV